MVKKILKEVDEPLEEGEFIEDDDAVDKIEKEPEVKPKQKRVLTEKQKEATRANLAKGREALKKKQEEQRDFSKKKAEELVIKKANLIMKQKISKEEKIKSVIGISKDDADDDETEVEEIIKKKPKKKRYVVRDESDTEQEIIIKRKPKQPLPAPEPKPTPVQVKQYLHFV